MYFLKVVSPWRFSSKILKFLFFFLLGTFLLEKVFGDVLYRKLASFDHKNIDLKEKKKLHTSKGVSPWFWSKMSYNFIFFVSKFGVKTWFGGFLDRKLAFLNH